MKVVIATGGFDPIHEGHIEYFKEAHKLGDILVIGINSDDWLVRKKGYFVQTYETRKAIISNLRMVDFIINFDDSDGSSCDAIIQTQKYYGKKNEYVFVNGGDRTKENIPEMNVFGVSFVFGVGGSNKMNSSSDIIKRLQNAICK